jgi:hypothetical protein
MPLSQQLRRKQQKNIINFYYTILHVPGESRKGERSERARRRESSQEELYDEAFFCLHEDLGPIKRLRFYAARKSLKDWKEEGKSWPRSLL